MDIAVDALYVVMNNQAKKIYRTETEYSSRHIEAEQSTCTTLTDACIHICW
jgi:hypothetical protein